jgi:hypothetical protein
MLRDPTPTFSMRRRTGRAGLAIAATMLAAVTLAACGGSQPTHGDPLASLLADIPANAQTRTDIVLNNLEAVRTASGLPTTLSVGHLTGRELSALTREPLTGETPLGSGLLPLTSMGSKLVSEVGYDPLRVTAELGVGNAPDAISVVDGSFSTAAVTRALTSYGWTRQAAPSDTYGGSTNLGSQLSAVLSSLRRVTVTGSRLVGTGAGVSSSELAGAVKQRPVHGSLASDPQVKAVLGMLGPSETMQLGTSLVSRGIGALLGPSATPQQRQEVVDRLGLRNLPSPTFGGFALRKGGTWRTVTLYASAQDAARAAPLIAGALRNGTDPVTNEPYSKLARPLSIKVDGNAVVTNLAASSQVPQMIERADLPQFI